MSGFIYDTVRMDELRIGGVRQYCNGCCAAAPKAGRIVRKVGEHNFCPLCESRWREGLIHYRPSNGSEFHGFLSRCQDCRHHIDDPDDPQPGRLSPPFTACAWGVLDRLHVQMCEGYDHASNWFDPADLRDACWAECLRFTHRNDGDGQFRDPPPPDCVGQLFFSDILEVPERVPVCPVAAGTRA